jgi:hypothetical protein
MAEAANRQSNLIEATSIAHLWEHPNLTVALFGMHIHSPAMLAEYEATGISKQMEESLSQEPGLLCQRIFEQPNGVVLLQYWRSHEDLWNYSRRMPHMVWWKWLVENEGRGLGFYHEVFQCKTAEAIYTKGTERVGAATFSTLSTVTKGEGKSMDRQRLFIEAAEAASVGGGSS